MIPGTDLHQFDVHNDGYFSHLPLNYVDGVILEMAIARMPQAITIEMDACVYKIIGPPKKRYCNDFFVDEMVDWAEMEVETEGVEARTNKYLQTRKKRMLERNATEGAKMEVETESMYSTVLPPKPRKMPGRPKKKKIRAIGEGGSSTRISKLVDDSNDVDVVLRGQVRDEGASGSRGGATGSRGRRGATMSRGGASGSRGGASVSRRVVGRGAGGSGGASGSRGRGADGSKRKSVSTAETQKRQGKKKVGTSGFAKWFGLQDELEQTQDEPQQTQHEPVVTQDEDQVEQTEDQVEIKLTQLEQT
ncbi:hypothetical protein Tco_0648278 [Tanacetum coccineum]